MFRNFLNSQRWKAFSHSFGRHSNRVAQQDFNATVVDYIFELESQVKELNERVDALSSEGRSNDQGQRRAFMRYQTEGNPSRKIRKAYPWSSDKESYPTNDYEEEHVEHDDATSDDE